MCRREKKVFYQDLPRFREREAFPSVHSSKLREPGPVFNEMLSASFKYGRCGHFGKVPFLRESLVVVAACSWAGESVIAFCWVHDDRSAPPSPLPSCGRKGRRRGKKAFLLPLSFFLPFSGCSCTRLLTYFLLLLPLPMYCSGCTGTQARKPGT